MFPFVIGVTDGILTALTLAAGRIVEPSQALTIGLALRISGAASLSGVFVFFTAEYIRLRGDLARSERQLNLTSAGRLATTRLGRAILIETIASAVVSSICNFLGALIPLTAGTIASWLAIAVALLLLAFLGVGAGRAVHGNPFVWAVALVLAGGILTLAGIEFRIV
jgi:predicted membrane protein (TIGR00267 family)